MATAKLTEPVAATAADRREIIALLAAAGLPWQDLGEEHLSRFVVIRVGDTVKAAAALERHGDDGLLRSVAVSDELRGRGAGRALVGVIEERARREGLRALYLLTTTARSYFARLGYEIISREQVPEAVARSTEFATLCPASATCMMKTLR